MHIQFSLHSLSKIEILKNHGINISKKIIENIIEFPDKIETGYNGRFVAQKTIDDDHVMRVVYETKEVGISIVVTVYPGKRSRYE